MKRQLRNRLTQIAFLTVIAAFCAVGSAHGQSLNNQVKANIPFDFVVAEKRLPAGEYVIGRARRDYDDTVLQVTSIAGRESAFRLTTPVGTLESKHQGRLIFHRYGDEYFLWQVWDGSSSTGRMLSESRGERAAKARVSADKLAPKTATVTVVGGTTIND